MNKPVPQIEQNHERSAEPAMTRPNTEADSILIFSVGPVELCVSMQNIQSVQDMQTLSTIPTSAAYILGGFWHQEKYVPVINTRYKFALPEPEVETSGSLITTYVGDDLFAFRVDKIIGVTSADRYQWQKLPRLGTGIFQHALTSTTGKDEKIKLEVDLKSLKDAPYLNVNSLLPLLGSTVNTDIESATSKKETTSNGALKTKNNAATNKGVAGNDTTDNGITDKSTTNKGGQQQTISPNNSSIPDKQSMPANSGMEAGNQANNKSETDNNNTTTPSAGASIETAITTTIETTADIPRKESCSTEDSTNHPGETTNQNTNIITNNNNHTVNHAAISIKTSTNTAKMTGNSTPNKTTEQNQSTLSDRLETKAESKLNSHTYSTQTQAIKTKPEPDLENNTNNDSSISNIEAKEKNSTAFNINEATASFTNNTNKQNLSRKETPENTTGSPLLFVIFILVFGIVSYYFWPSDNKTATAVKSSSFKTTIQTHTSNRSSMPNKPDTAAPEKETTAEQIKIADSSTTETIQNEVLEPELTQTATTEPEAVETRSAKTETPEPGKIIIDLADHEIIIERHSTSISNEPVKPAKIAAIQTAIKTTPPARQTISPQPGAPTQTITPALSNNPTASQQNYNLPENILFKHVVKRGDTLWHIAGTYLGNPYKYPELANLSGINNPDLIYPGDVVKMRKK